MAFRAMSELRSPKLLAMTRLFPTMAQSFNGTTLGLLVVPLVRKMTVDIQFDALQSSLSFQFYVTLAELDNLHGMDCKPEGQFSESYRY